MGVPTIKTGPMSVEEYFAFTDTRPDNEKWELIDGEPILNASPSGTASAGYSKTVIYLLAAARAPNLAPWEATTRHRCKSFRHESVLSPTS